MTCRQILLIDDETDIQTVAKIGLTLNTDWQIMTANSGEAGLEAAIANPPDAILLDVAMPGMDGLATIAALKQNPVTARVPIIFLTAKAQASDRRRLYEAGASGVITKPFDPTTLASQVAGFLAWQL
ncbi:response regulator containing a -like receiver domain protein and an hd-gyp domain protein [Leptolyngbya sp. Heron Island J]|uniref:response regulator n=1 Tax=Leptolyngbya sp. Heron Island J TaxID=1385935 RepID=UPI0003B9D354|nr:response regulator [Leptolyngbya sp. Heron Island J]ESA36496.1 response regulator containing a -like receiver domain protein and an hd-gyp domain protein [Leptolyngbya sp. Heron Island J]